MTAKLHPYPSYKPSSVKWLGDMPAHWELQKLRNELMNEYRTRLIADVVTGKLDVREAAVQDELAIESEVNP